MDRQHLIDNMQSFVLGSLSDVETEEIKQHFKEQTDFPWQDLGEYQTLMALLAALIDIHADKEKLKKSFEENVIANIKSNANAPVNEFDDFQEVVPVRTNLTKLNNQLDDSGSSIESPQEEVADAFIRGDHALKDDSSNIENNEEEEEEQEEEVSKRKSNTFAMVVLFILLLLTAGAAFYIYFDFTSKISVMQNELVDLRGKQTNVASDIQKTKQLQDFILSNNDIIIKNLADNKGASAKLFYTGKGGNGYLLVNKLDSLEKGAYVLWIIINNKNNLITAFNVANEKEIISVNLKQYELNGNSTIYITKEQNSSPVYPSSDIVLN